MNVVKNKNNPNKISFFTWISHETIAFSIIIAICIFLTNNAIAGLQNLLFHYSFQNSKYKYNCNENVIVIKKKEDIIEEIEEIDIIRSVLIILIQIIFFLFLSFLLYQLFVYNGMKPLKIKK